MFFSSKKESFYIPPSPDTKKFPPNLPVITLGPAYNKFSYNEHPVYMINFFLHQSKSLMAMFKSSVTTSTRAFNEQFLLHLFH